MSSVSTPRQEPAIWAYVQIARPDHWIKNAFMLLGLLLAFFYRPDAVGWHKLGSFALAFVATCIVASSNYVLNELLDGPTDRLHPEKRHRPVPSGRIRPALAYLEWLALGALGIGMAFLINVGFAASAGWLWLMGLVYNIPPLRTKEWPYLDVLTESVNNPIRLLLGWFAVIGDTVPPVSLAISYWMVGAFFMATKRFAEYRHIGDPAVAAAYRSSFKYYNEERLLVSMLFYAIVCALFAGIFIVRYHVELILFTPFAAGLFAYYLKLGLKPDSPTQKPENLYKETGFVIYLVACTLAFVVLMLTSIPFMYELFNVQPSGASPLWRLGR
jgi:4-hydroxybenzoate polyprenyltransferase